MSNRSPQNFQIAFTPEKILDDVERELAMAFRRNAMAQIEFFVGERRVHTGNGVEVIPGAGRLLIQDWLEKKFDDPATIEMMEKFFNENFERLMTAAIEKAVQHKANGMVFGKMKKKDQEDKQNAAA